MAAEPDEFEIHVVKHCPSDASYYYLLRFDERGESVRFPHDRALRIRGPFEHPIDCKPGYWLVIYTSDHLGHTKIQHIGGKPHVEVRLNLPASVCAAPAGGDSGKSTQELVDMLTKAAEEEDDADGSLKATRIDAKKREIALALTAKEQKLMLRSAKNKEIAEGFLLNRSHRLEVREQSEAMFKLQHQSVAMMERTFVLMEKMQEVFGRFAEIEKAAAQKMASPPPPIDYSPVLSSVVGAIRDIGVSALQRDDKKKLKADEDASPVKAALTDKAGSSGLGAVESGTGKPSSAIAAPSTPPALPAAENASVPDLLALVERMKAERERLQSELAAERGRQRVLNEIEPKSPSRATPASARAAEPARSSSSVRGSPSAGTSPSTMSSSSAPSGRTSPSVRSAPSAQTLPSARSSRSRQRPRPARPSESSGPARRTSLDSAALPNQRLQSLHRASGSAPGMKREQPAPAEGERRNRSSAGGFSRGASRNAPCACGSGRKFKHCCMHKHRSPVPLEPASQVVPAKPAAPHGTSVQGPYGKPSLSVPQTGESTTIPGQTSAPSSQAQPAQARPLSANQAAQPKEAALATNTKVPPAIKPAPQPEIPPPAGSAAPPSAADVARAAPDRAEADRPRSTPAAVVQGTDASASQPPSPAERKSPRTFGSADQEAPIPPIELPPGVVREEVQELLVNMLAGKLLSDPDAPIARPQVPEVKQVEEVLVSPPKMDRETAERLLKDGSTLEAFGAFLFFNPALRAALLSRRGK